MKKITFLVLLLTSAISFGQASDLFFSMYGEGSSSNKWIEIYNGTGDDVDLTNYSVVIFTNGSTDPGNDYMFDAGTMLAAGDVFVIGNSSADASILDAFDVTDDVTFFNGDDAVVLYNNGTMIDLIGEIGTDPGSAWPVAGIADASGDHTLIRKSTVCSGNITGLGSFGTDADTSEWEVYDNDTQWDAIGSHTANCGSASVHDNSLKSFVMYPNPSSTGKVHIETKEAGSVKVTVFDILGKKVIAKTIENNELNISGLNTGIYLIQVSQNGATVTKKLIVE